MDKIKELEEQLRKAREEAESQSKDKYKYLVGKCFRTAFTSYEYITGIDRSNGETVFLDCISIYMDPRFPDSETQINNKSWCQIDIEDLDRCKIDKSEFDKVLQEAIQRIQDSAKVDYNKQD